MQWGDFKKDVPGNFKKHGNKIKVFYNNTGHYFNAYFHKPWGDMGYKEKEDYVESKHYKKKFYKCDLCERVYYTRYVVPYDGSYPPGWYCYWCRKKKSIMDVKDAKHYGKIL